MLYPAAGGETGDALMVHLPASGVLFAGDVLMPYLGQPFTDEGSPEGLLEALAFIDRLRPRLLIHGHPPLTDLLTAAAVPGLEAALTQLHGEVLDGIRRGRTLPDILAAASLPDVLREHPAAVVPYLVTRDHFTARLYHQRTGYWQPDGTGMEPSTAAEHAAALDLLAGGRQERFADAAATLIAQGDHALALEIIKPGLLRYPASSALAKLRRTASARCGRYQHRVVDRGRARRRARSAGRRPPGTVRRRRRHAHRPGRPRARARRSSSRACSATPASSALAELRQTALHRLMERYQQSDPFKFLIYAEQAGAELGPVG